MSGQVCAITGASGFIGAALARYLQGSGWKVIALIRDPRRVAANMETREFQLGEPVAPQLLEGVDNLIHAAYDFSLYRWSDICRVNIVGSEYLFDAATRAGVKRQIFISSFSAFEGCRSLYGRSKLATEETARVRGGIVVRPGTVYGEKNGGIAAKIATVARRSPIVPMIDNGNDPLYTCHIDDLCKLLGHLAETEHYSSKPITAAHDKPTTLRSIVGAASEGKSRIIVPIPWQILATGLWLAERVGLKPALRSDSVISFVHKNPAPDFSFNKTLPIQFRPFQANFL